MDYRLLELKITPLEPFREWLTFQLSGCGFDMFEDTEEGLKAYCPERDFSNTSVDEILKECRELGAEVRDDLSLIPSQNWNAEWEKQFDPEVIGGLVHVRAEFHAARPDLPLEIVIQPKMAFGTGHHPTTSQVMESMLKMDLNGKMVIDMGCGTAILAILALMRGAKAAIAIDNDTNAVENSRENILRNHTQNIAVIEGDASSLIGLSCDLFIANINRNIILQDIEKYVAAMLPGAILLTSGYYEQDLPMILQKAASLGLHYTGHTAKNEWCCAGFVYKP